MAVIYLLLILLSEDASLSCSPSISIRHIVGSGSLSYSKPRKSVLLRNSTIRAAGRLPESIALAVNSVFDSLHLARSKALWGSKRGHSVIKWAIVSRTAQPGHTAA